MSLLEVAFLSEIGRLECRQTGFTEALMSDPRFVFDDVPLTLLIRYAVEESWTRDPFDRLLVGHSNARRLPFITADITIRKNHRLLARELRPDTR